MTPAEAIKMVEFLRTLRTRVTEGLFLEAGTDDARVTLQAELFGRLSAKVRELEAEPEHFARTMHPATKDDIPGIMNRDEWYGGAYEEAR